MHGNKNQCPVTAPRRAAGSGSHGKSKFLLSLACFAGFAALLGCFGSSLATAAIPEFFVNSLGMKMVGLKPGAFQMGSSEGEWDERPVHQVSISQALFMAVTEVSNSQYEQFDLAHKALRGTRGISQAGDEAVVFVSWHNAVKFCEWLSAKEDKPYRLPTEAEWEYACRAGTTTAYHSGEQLASELCKRQEFSWDPNPVSLRVGQTRPNRWGLCDMHGNVEEWCLDWYGPYAAGDQADPVGHATGDFRVSRRAKLGT
jgi:formylglycine-generating enzyme